MKDTVQCYPLVRVMFKPLTAMKLTIVFFLATLHVHANVHAQTITLSERNTSLENVFKKIEKQTGYHFVYRDEWMRQAKKVNIDIKNGSLEQVLAICFKDQPLAYAVVESTIVIRWKAESEKKDQSENAVPLIDVKGRIINEKGEPVAGATVSIKGTMKSTATNESGEFIIKEVDGNATLVISSVSFETQEIKLGGRTEILVQLKIEIGELSSVSVTVSTGYQVLPKERVTGSFTQPDKQIYNSRVAPDIISKLEGITNGLVFHRGRTGEGLGIRGRSTIFANDQPLIVVDNFPYDGDINNINPNDVESITVLKDAAAASIWGVQAGNGVIVITTKRGRLNQPLKIELNTNVTIAQKPDLYYDPSFLKSNSFIDVETFLFGNNFYEPDFTSFSQTPISPVVEILNNRKLGIISAADSVAQINAFRQLDIRGELAKYYYRKAVNQQYALNLSGGGNKAAYFLSVGFDQNKSSLVGNQFDRVTLSSFTTFHPVKNLELTGGVNFTQRKNSSNSTIEHLRTGGSKSYRILPYAQLADAQGNALPILKDYRASYADAAGDGKFLNWRYYPLNELELSDNTGKLNDIRVNANIKYTILKGLSAEVKYQFEKGIAESRSLRSLETYYTRDLINRFSSIRPDGTVKNNIPAGAILDLSNSDLASNRIRAQVNYTNNWNKNDISVIAGVEATEVKTDGNSDRTYGYDPLTLTYLPINFDSIYYDLNPSGSSAIEDNRTFSGTLNRFRSYFVNAAYTYNNRYTLSASGRIDQSNFFGVKANQRSVPLWSVGGKWDISKETFYRMPWLSMLSLRATYGFNGNLDKSVTAFTTARYESPGGGAVNLPYVTILTPPNPELQWEKTAMLNIGLDFSLKKGIVSGSIEYYRKRGTDLMGDVVLAPSAGFISPNLANQSIRGNFAAMKGEGFDVAVSTRNINKKFKWSTTFLFSYTTDKVTRYEKENPANTSVTIGTNSYPVVGKPVYSLYSYAWAGLDPDTGEPMGYVDKTVSKDYGALTTPTEFSDIVYNGSARPVYFGGITNSFSWKGITLRANISYKLGYYFRRSSIDYNTLFNYWGGHRDFEMRWQKPGDEKITNVPSMLYPANPGRDNFYTSSEVLVEKGDHIRLQDISISYDLDKSQWRVLPLNHIQLYLYANNLGILWRANKYSIDPDYEAGFPAPRSLSLGLKASF